MLKWHSLSTTPPWFAWKGSKYEFCIMIQILLPYCNIQRWFTRTCNIHSFLHNIQNRDKNHKCIKLTFFSCQGDHNVSQNMANTSPTRFSHHYVNFDCKMDHLMRSVTLYHEVCHIITVKCELQTWDWNFSNQNETYSILVASS